MADGVMVTQFFFNFANFSGAETKLALLIAGLCGDGGQRVEMYDEELAEHARYTDRTIRQWRADYLSKARGVRFSPIIIDEGEYDPQNKRYLRTSYTIAPEFAEAINRAVAEARAMPEYETDRLRALERAAGTYFDDLPNAPPNGGGSVSLKNRSGLQLSRASITPPKISLRANRLSTRCPSGCVTRCSPDRVRSCARCCFRCRRKSPNSFPPSRKMLMGKSLRICRKNLPVSPLCLKIHEKAAAE
jgi:hypothetical protein